jgi:hypothetical protein
MNRLLALIYTCSEDTPVPPDYTFSFSLEPQRRSVYVYEDCYYPTPPRFVNPWNRRVDDDFGYVPDLVDDLNNVYDGVFPDDVLEDDPDFTNQDFRHHDPTDHGNQGSYEGSMTYSILIPAPQTKRIK